MDDSYQAFKSILDENCKSFVKKCQRSSDIGPFRKYRKDTADFPIFKPANDEYFEYSYFEKALECDLRDLVNQTISDFFEYKEEHGYSNIQCRFPTHDKYLVMASNESYENYYPFEFIINTDSQKIGYRYTSMVECEGENYIDNQIAFYQLDHIAIIKWEEDYKPKQTDDLDERIDVISIKEFFSEYFDEEIYDLFIEKVTIAVQDANEAIGFKTIPNLSLRFLSIFREKMEAELQEIKFDKLKYTVLQKKNRKKYAYLESYNFDAADVSILEDNFIGNKLYEALLGNEPFAKCFLTSEYLFQVFSGNNEFDYTAVISGYTKAVELLLEKIVRIDLEYGDPYKKNYISKRYDQKKPPEKQYERRKKSGAKYFVYLIPFNDHNVKNYNVDLTMGSLIYYLYDNDDKWLIDEKYKKTLFDYLQCYTDECRNEYFHKGILDSKRAKAIRENTLFILYLLIGGCSNLKRVPDIDRYLGITSSDWEFRKMYKALKEIPPGIIKYLVEEPNGKEVKLIKLFKQPDTVYDEFGNISQSEILFIRVDSFDVDYEKINKMANDDNRYSININNIPKSVKLPLIDGRIKLVEW